MREVTDLSSIIDALGDAEQLQSANWLVMLELEEALSRARHAYIEERMSRERFCECADIIEAEWHQALTGWRTARELVRVRAAQVDGLLLR